MAEQTPTFWADLFVVFLMGCVVWLIIRELFRNLKESEQEFRSETVTHLIKTWLHADTEERPKMLERLRKLGSIAYLEPFFIEAYIQGSERDQGTFDELYHELGICDQLRETLSGSYPSIERQEAILKMAKLGGRDDLLYLSSAIEKESDEFIKTHMLDAVSQLFEKHLKKDKPYDLGTLLKLLNVPKLRERVMTVLRDYKDDAITDQLIPYLNDKDDTVRQLVIELLSEYMTPAIKKKFQSLLNDESLKVQAKAYWSFAVQEDPKIYGQLIERLHDPDFCEAFFSQLSYEKREYMESFFRYVGIDAHLFFKRFGWGKFSQYDTALEMTAEESGDPLIKARAIQTIALWKKRRKKAA